MSGMAVCEEKSPASCTVFNCVRSVNCGKETAQWMLPQRTVLMVQWSIKQGISWLRRWINLRGEYAELAVVYIHPKDNSIVSNKASPNHFLSSLSPVIQILSVVQKDILFSDFWWQYSKYLLFSQNEQTHSTLQLANSLLVLVTFIFF
jgi:hypothetical protein